MKLQQFNRICIMGGNTGIVLIVDTSAGESESRLESEVWSLEIGYKFLDMFEADSPAFVDA